MNSLATAKGGSLKVFILISLLVMVPTVNASEEYFTIDEYRSLHPEQVKIGERFSEIIRKPAKKLKDKKRISISIIYPGDQLSDYWVRSVKSFRKRLDEIGVNYDITEYFSTVGQNRKQTRDIREALAGDPDYLVFTLDVKKHKKIVGNILSGNRTKIILQNITTPLKKWEKNQPLLYVGFDHIDGSKVLANHYKSILGGKGKYGLLFFQPGYVSEMRGEMFVRYLNKTSNLKMGKSFYTDGSFRSARVAALQMVNEGYDFIYACATDVALGAISAIEAKKLKKRPLVNGWGGGSRELEAIEKGKMDFTVMRMNDDNGVAMAEAIRLNMQGESEKVPTVYSGDFVLVKKGISKQEILRLKKRAFRYSGVDE